MNNKNYYPVNLSLENQRALIVGFGEVGQRKLSGLLETDIDSVLILDPLLSLNSLAIYHDARINFEARAWNEADIDGCYIIFAATNSDMDNSKIVSYCKKRNKLCNSATRPEAGNFIVPAIVKNGGISIAISTNGQSPALARRIKKELRLWLEPYKRLAWILGKLRQPILNQNNDQASNAKFFRNLAQSDLGNWLSAGEIEKSKIWLRNTLPQSINIDLDSLFTEYGYVFS